LPGIAAILLSILALLVSILALLLLTVPVYRLLSWLVRPSVEREEEESEVPEGEDQFVDPAEPVEPSSEVDGEHATEISEPARPVSDPTGRPRRRIDVKIIE